jgi:hypothetical protein
MEIIVDDAVAPRNGTIWNNLEQIIASIGTGRTVPQLECHTHTMIEHAGQLKWAPKHSMRRNSGTGVLS